MSLAVRTLLITLEPRNQRRLFFADELEASMLRLGTLTLTIVSLLSDVIGRGRSAWAERPGFRAQALPAGRTGPDCALPPMLNMR